MDASNKQFLRLIAAFKLLKTMLLIVLGIGALKMIHMDAATVLYHWVERLGLDPGNRIIERAFDQASDMTPHKMQAVGIGSLVYAALFLVEGTGLWMAKHWAEWLTVIITGSLIPVEVYELFRHPSAIKGLLLVVNIAVVVYLIYRIRMERSERKGS